MTKLYCCDSCKLVDEKIFCCQLCARLVCNDCIGDILCGGAVEITENGMVCNRPCYKCAAFVIVPLLMKDQLRTLSYEFLSEMVLCYSNPHRRDTLKTHSEVLKYLDVMWKPSLYALNYFHVRWHSLLLSHSADVKNVIKLYKSCGFSYLRTPPILPRYLPSSALLHREFSLRTTGTRRPHSTELLRKILETGEPTSHIFDPSRIPRFLAIFL